MSQPDSEEDVVGGWLSKDVALSFLLGVDWPRVEHSSVVRVSFVSTMPLLLTLSSHNSGIARLTL